MEWSKIANLAVAILGGGGALIALVVFLAKLAAKVDRIDENVRGLLSTVNKMLDYLNNLGERTARMEGCVENHSRNFSDLNRSGKHEREN